LRYRLPTLAKFNINQNVSLKLGAFFNIFHQLGNALLKNKMIEFLNVGQKSAEAIEEYAVHRISFLCSTHPDFNEHQ
jgi:hypothetical protein